MKKKNCRMTESESLMHDRAVMVRKKTDEQLCAYLDELAYRDSGHTESTVADFIRLMMEKAGTGNGIGKATAEKVKSFAVNEGFMEG